MHRLRNMVRGGQVMTLGITPEVFELIIQSSFFSPFPTNSVHSAVVTHPLSTTGQCLKTKQRLQ